MDVLGGCNDEMQKKRVLLIEDEDEVRNSVQTILEAQGYEVILATNGQEGLDALQTMAVAPCLILLDLLMPVMDGWAFLKHLRTSAPKGHIPIVAFSHECVEQKARFTQIKKVLTKPIEFYELLSVLEDYC